MASFELGDEGLAALRDLWPVFAVNSNAEALRMSVALARVVSPYVDARGNVTIKQGDNELLVNVRRKEGGVT